MTYESCVLPKTEDHLLWARDNGSVVKSVCCGSVRTVSSNPQHLCKTDRLGAPGTPALWEWRQRIAEACSLRAYLEVHERPCLRGMRWIFDRAGY